MFFVGKIDEKRVKITQKTAFFDEKSVKNDENWSKFIKKRAKITKKYVKNCIF